MKDTIYIREGDRICGLLGGNYRDFVVLGDHFGDFHAIDVEPAYDDEDSEDGETLTKDYIITRREVSAIAGYQHASFMPEDNVLWFPDEGAPDIFGGESPCCIDTIEVVRLSREWDVNLFNQLHRATPEEIAEYGSYSGGNPATYVVRDREAGNVIECVSSIEEGEALIEEYEEEDRKDGTFTPDFYEVVKEED